LHARKITAPSIIGDKLVVADYQGYLHWFGKSDGKLLGRIRTTDKRNYVQPQIWSESVVTLDESGFLVSVSQRIFSKSGGKVFGVRREISGSKR
jgi:outer membrane protein assembly factor BamB